MSPYGVIRPQRVKTYWCHRTNVIIGSGNGDILFSTKPSPEPMMNSWQLDLGDKMEAILFQPQQLPSMSPSLHARVPTSKGSAPVVPPAWRCDSRLVSSSIQEESTAVQVRTLLILNGRGHLLRRIELDKCKPEEITNLLSSKQIIYIDSSCLGNLAILQTRHNWPAH